MSNCEKKPRHGAQCSYEPDARRVHVKKYSISEAVEQLNCYDCQYKKEKECPRNFYKTPTYGICGRFKPNHGIIVRTA